MFRKVSESSGMAASLAAASWRLAKYANRINTPVTTNEVAA
jgi:hypothetical protein